MSGLFGQQQFPPVGMPQNAPSDMSVMYPQGHPQIQTPQMPGNGQASTIGVPVEQQLTSMTPEQAQSDAMDASLRQQQQSKYSVGVPELDKYINMFLGA